MNTKDVIKDIKNREYIFDFINLNENHEMISNRNKKWIGKYKIETLKKAWIGELICSTSKVFSLNCKSDDESKSKLKGVSNFQSKQINFEEYKKCLYEDVYQKEYDVCTTRSLCHATYLQQIKYSTISWFDDKRCYINQTESKPWNWINQDFG